MSKGTKSVTIAVVGGDKRSAYLAEILRRNGADVVAFGLNADVESVDLSTALKCRVVVLPLPVTKDGTHIYAPESESELKLVDIITGIDSRTLVLGGNLSAELIDAFKQKGIRARDYYKLSSKSDRSHVVL